MLKELRHLWLSQRLEISPASLTHGLVCVALCAACALQEVDEPSSCRLLTFWEYLEQCK
jgi:hypothetical protein